MRKLTQLKRVVKSKPLNHYKNTRYNMGIVYVPRKLVGHKVIVICVM